MIEIREELASTITDIKQPAKDRLSASDRLGLLDMLIDLPLEIAQGE